MHDRKKPRVQQTLESSSWYDRVGAACSAEEDPTIKGPDISAITILFNAALPVQHLRAAQHKSPSMLQSLELTQKL
jgi:hypothetical protein